MHDIRFSSLHGTVLFAEGNQQILVQAPIHKGPKIGVFRRLQKGELTDFDLGLLGSADSATL